MAFTSKDDNAAFTLPAILPDEARYVDFDFSKLFDSGVTLQGLPTVEVTVLGGAVDATPENIKSGAVAVGTGAASMIASQLVEECEAGTVYQLRCLATGSNDAKEGITLILPCVATRFG